MIGIIDYDAGNVKSVSKAVEKLGGQAVISCDPGVLDGCKGLILPGVGSFRQAAENLRSRGMDLYMKKAASEGRLMMGICLGMQMLFERSFEDGESEGLGLLKGSVVRFGSICPRGGRAGSQEVFDTSLKIPHMGWNRLIKNREDSICAGIGEDEYAYFVHSFYAVPEDWNDVVYYADYSVSVPGVVRKGNVLGMQFHPEKSSKTGLQLLSSFLREAGEIA